jgi:tape measure domain-containing protein
MADETIIIDVNDKVDVSIAAKIRDIGRAAVTSANELDALKAALSSVTSNSPFKVLSTDVNQLRAELTRLQSANVNVNNGINTITTSARGASGELRALAGYVAAAFSISAIVQAQDAYTSITNQLGSLNEGLKETTALQNALFATANQVRVPVDDLTASFVRFQKVLPTENNSSVLRFVKTLTEELATSGRSTAEVSSIVTQLGQALNSGRLQGDEFRSLSENVPTEVLNQFAKTLNILPSNLKAAASEGLITTKVIKDSFDALAASADASFAKVVPTISSALTVVRNNFIAFFGETQGFAGLVANAILLIGANLDKIIPTVAAFAAVWLTIQAATVLYNIGFTITTVLIPALISGTIGTLAFLGPWGLLAVAVLATAAAIAYFTGALDPFLNAIGQGIGRIGDMIKQMSISALASDQATAQLEALGDSAGLGGQAMGQLSDQTAAATKSIKGLGTASDTAAKQTVASVNTIVAAFGKMSAAAIKAHTDAYNALNAAGGAQGSFQTAGVSNTGANSSITTIGRPPAPTPSVVGNVPGISTSQRVAAPQAQRVASVTTNNVTNISFSVVSPNADSFQRSRKQLGQQVGSAISAVM